MTDSNETGPKGPTNTAPKGVEATDKVAQVAETRGQVDVIEELQINPLDETLAVFDKLVSELKLTLPWKIMKDEHSRTGYSLSLPITEGYYSHYIDHGFETDISKERFGPTGIPGIPVVPGDSSSPYLQGLVYGRTIVGTEERILDGALDKIYYYFETLAFGTRICPLNEAVKEAVQAGNECK